MAKKIRVGILDDHQAIIDGYTFRLRDHPEIEVAATAHFGDELEEMVQEHDLDILLLDITLPTAPDNSNPYPVLHLISKVLREKQGIAILVVSMHNQDSLIRAVMEAGASGYIVKDDHDSIQNLGDIITSVVRGGVYFSQNAYKLITQQGSKEVERLTPRQREVLSLLASRPYLTTAGMAEVLEVAPSTIRNLLSDAYERLEVPNRAAAIVKARQLGLITPDKPRAGD
jgi:two-component system nitrate/nitrite response regulator NarL